MAQAFTVGTVDQSNGMMTQDVHLPSWARCRTAQVPPNQHRLAECQVYHGINSNTPVAFVGRHL